MGPRLTLKEDAFIPLNAELNPICHLLALLGGATIVVVSRLRVKPVTRKTLQLAATPADDQDPAFRDT